ncbi:MAG: 30S ribosomal protein S27e [Candidatus Diapherotrites archaeon]|nr:30S ribosomal protein S27e [Candidatus Diapherotrites archaeon]
MEENFQPKYNKFWRIKCKACGNEQVVFSCASRDILCNVCNALLAESTAHRIRLKDAKKIREY